MDDYERRFLESMHDQRVGGRYVVQRVLGAGGMGLVAAGYHPELGQEVAIKFMRAEMAGDSTLSARFLREARIAARTRSPHFVRVFDFGLLETGVPYLVMEMLHGRDLGSILEERGPLPVAQAVDYLLQAMVGLAEIHAQGVVHRDLKPANLFLAEAAGTRTVKVLDLGLSKESTTGLTSTGHSFGTPHYMSPEQIRESKSVDTRSDVWALGVILYELLTARLPYGDGATATGEVFGAVLHTAPVPLRQVAPNMPEELEGAITRCLARDPRDRFADLGAFAEVLRPFAGPASIARIDAIHEALHVSLGATRLLAGGGAEAKPTDTPAPPTVKGGGGRRAEGEVPVRGAGSGPSPAASFGQSEMVAVRANATASVGESGRPGSRAAKTVLVAAASIAVIGAAATFALVKLGPPPAPRVAPRPRPSPRPRRRRAPPRSRSCRSLLSRPPFLLSRRRHRRRLHRRLPLRDRRPAAQAQWALRARRRPPATPGRPCSTDSIASSYPPPRGQWPGAPGAGGLLREGPRRASAGRRSKADRRPRRRRRHLDRRRRRLAQTRGLPRRPAGRSGGPRQRQRNLRAARTAAGRRAPLDRRPDANAHEPHRASPGRQRVLRRRSRGRTSSRHGARATEIRPPDKTPSRS